MHVIRAESRLDTYGSPRMHKELQHRGIIVSENTVANLMRQHQMRAKQSKPFRPTTTHSQHTMKIAPNRLNREFTVKTLNQVWLLDFTYLPTDEGFTYLCSVEDLCSRRIVGWATSRHIDAPLALAALNQALALRSPPPGLIVHSDRGSQFASEAFQQRLEKAQCLQSMSRKGDCYDNAPKESFYKSYKVEEVNHNHYATHEEATRFAADYIDRFYNTRRRHSAIGYVSPLEFETRLLLQTQSEAEICLRRSHSSVARLPQATDNGNKEADFYPAFVGDFRESDLAIAPHNQTNP
jgi:transposase InsO family protein